ncbi:hypothetical protein HU200_061490 [Digitaria exilis]|uniref:F-box domain-containing protein n=1 Tax=Digitaria exilis TaxID=1010633 RepID=A0A835DZA1_9POAL|nr:hypothetical protein HU200_061490 [Digitaria exilis]
MDVLFEVLLRFPTDELCRLRLVCRSWRSLTTDQVFATAHASRVVDLTGIHTIRHGRYEVCVVDLSGNVVKRIPINHDGVCITQIDRVCVSEQILQPKLQVALKSMGALSPMFIFFISRSFLQPK